MTKKKNIIYLCAILLFPALSGCHYLNHRDISAKPKTQNGYYSIKGFLDDQWHLLHGTPIVLLRVAAFNHHSDSSFVPLDSALWQNIRKQFDPSDIGEARFIGQYKFSTYPDNSLSLIFLNYEAKNKALFTRNMNISIDNVNHKIKSIFIQTAKHSRTFEKTQKLTYLPGHLIRIQSFEKSIVSNPESLIVSYYFDY